MPVATLIILSLVLGLVIIVEISSWLTPITEIQNHQKRTLVRFQHMCERLSIVYWGTSGTLLGAIRNGDIIRHDDDIDVSIHVRDLARLQRECRNSKDTLSPLLGKFTGIYRFGGKWAIDIFPVQDAEVDGFTRWHFMGTARTLWPREWTTTNPALRMVPFGKYRSESGTIEDVNIAIPDEAESFCQRAYGRWRIPKVTHVHSITGFKESWIYGVVLSGFLIVSMSSLIPYIIQRHKSTEQSKAQGQQYKPADTHADLSKPVDDLQFVVISTRK
jgi:hypothetical protein